ncbi:MAG TPA: hypothetical protein VGD98_19610 [Ktedonobacteraceae bacterium]
MTLAGDTGDLDIVALLPYGTIMIECKSSLLQADPATLEFFLWRAASFKADAALLLIDTYQSETAKEFRAVVKRLQHLSFLPQETEHGEHYWLRAGPIHARGPGQQTIYWHTGMLYAVLVGRNDNLEQTLAAIMSNIQSRQRWVTNPQQ